MPLSDDHKRKISEANKKYWTDERRKQYSEARKGESNPFFGRKHTNAYKEWKSKSQRGEANPFFGRSHRRETLQRVSKSKLGKSPKLYRYGITDEEYKQQTESGNRWCHFHKGFKPAESVSRSGVCAECKTAYERENMLKSRYGVTAEWYDAKLAEQNGGCAICGTSLLWRKKKFLAIDHCHTTNKNRGILCHRCNSVLGYVEKPGWLDAAVRYLNKYKE